jgi:transcription antitermination factor NusG
MSHVMGARWYVVQTQINSEAKAAQNLLRQA